MSRKKDRRSADSTQKEGISRREFARRAALASAAAAYVPASMLPAAEYAEAHAEQTSDSAPKLSREAQTEVDARVQAIHARHAHLSRAQRDEVRRLSIELQRTLDTLRKADVGNGDSPALYLKPLVEREKKPVLPARTAAKARKP